MGGWEAEVERTVWKMLFLVGQPFMYILHMDLFMPMDCTVGLTSVRKRNAEVQLQH